MNTKRWGQRPRPKSAALRGGAPVAGASSTETWTVVWTDRLTAHERVGGSGPGGQSAAGIRGACDVARATGHDIQRNACSAGIQE
ncbi:hypothetical protein GRC12_41495 [Streptomyces griseorubiginosus]|nr:hypothetical protein [Streptomyces griseorubiginosus]